MRKWKLGIIALASIGLAVGVLVPSLGNASQPDVGGGPFSTTTIVPEAPESQPGSKPGPRPKPADWTPAGLLARSARAYFGEEFAGVSASGAELTVHVKADGSSGVPETFEGYRVEVVALSLAELEGAKLRLGLDHKKVEDQGFVLASWGADIAANALKVDVVTDAARVKEAEAVIAEVLPGVPLVVIAVEGLAAPMARHNDTAGWGGAKIVSSGQTCTAGIGWVNQYGMEMMLTAGHCQPSTPAIWMNGNSSAAYGWQVWNGLDSAAPWRNDLAAMTSANGYVGAFYIAGPTNCCGVTVSSAVTGTQAGLTGVRTSGAISGETIVSPGAVIDENQIVSLPWGLVNGLNRADCYAQPGDSGAPVYRVTTGGAIQVLGILVAADGAPYATTRCWYTPGSVIYANHGGGPL